MDLLKAPAYVYYDITNYLIIAKVISNIKKKICMLEKFPDGNLTKGY